jgi:hypothetical protein
VQRGAKFVTSSAEEYRHYARQCLELAPTFQDKEARMSLLGSAQAWSRLADLPPVTKTNPSKKSEADKRWTLPSRQRTYRHLYVRVDQLEDAISHFYKVINELRGRVLTLEKQLKPSADRPAA